MISKQCSQKYYKLIFFYLKNFDQYLFAKKMLTVPIRQHIIYWTTPCSHRLKGGGIKGRGMGHDVFPLPDLGQSSLKVQFLSGFFFDRLKSLFNCILIQFCSLSKQSCNIISTKTLHHSTLFSQVQLGHILCINLKLFPFFHAGDHILQYWNKRKMK